MRTLSPKVREEAIQLYKQGVPIKQIIERLKIGHGSFWRIIKAANVEHRWKPCSEEEKTAIVTLYKQGLTVKDICKKIHRHRQTVSSILKEAGIQVRTNPLKDSALKIPDKEKLIYFAGIFDGEGCVRLFKEKKGGRLQPELKVTNTSKELADWLINNFGGRLRVFRLKEERHKPCYDWHIYRTKDIIRLLELILPYLIVKREKASLVLEVSKSKVCPNI